MEFLLLFFSSDHVSPFKVRARNSISAIPPPLLLPPCQKGPRSPMGNWTLFFFSSTVPSLCGKENGIIASLLQQNAPLCWNWKPAAKGSPLDGMAVSCPVSPEGLSHLPWNKEKHKKKDKKNPPLIHSTGIIITTFLNILSSTISLNGTDVGKSVSFKRSSSPPPCDYVSTFSLNTLLGTPEHSQACGRQQCNVSGNVHINRQNGKKKSDVSDFEGGTVV